MTPLEFKRASESLADTLERLIDELDHLPPGAVMRCFARAVRHARYAGFTPEELPAEVERRTRAMLEARRSGGLQSQPTAWRRHAERVAGS